MPPQRVILHVDLDAFYVAVEVRENPGLRSLPVVVGADPEGGRGRGVVVTCSYEARKSGLRSGMPISRAYKLCPSAVYLRPNFDLYECVSEQVMILIRHFADEFEQVGIDEAFLDVSRRTADSDQARELALALKRSLWDAQQLTCSIGIGPNKSSAKIASDRQKPNGLTIVPPGGIVEFLAPLPVSAIPGVGRKTKAFLNEHRIGTISQLQEIAGKQLLTWFGKTGVWLWGVIHGQENIPVRAREMPKSLSVERTFREDVEYFGIIYDEVEDVAHELIERVRLAGLSFRTVGIKIRFHGFETHTRERSLVAHTDSETALREGTRVLLQEFESRGEPVRLIGVRVAQMRRKMLESSSLDSWTN